MCSIIGVGERLHNVLGQIDLGTLDSGERSLPFGLLVFLTQSDGRLYIAISTKFRYFQTFVNSEYTLKSLLTNVCQ